MTFSVYKLHLKRQVCLCNTGSCGKKIAPSFGMIISRREERNSVKSLFQARKKFGSSIEMNGLLHDCCILEYGNINLSSYTEHVDTMYILFNVIRCSIDTLKGLVLE